MSSLNGLKTLTSKGFSKLKINFSKNCIFKLIKALLIKGYSDYFILICHNHPRRAINVNKSSIIYQIVLDLKYGSHPNP